MAYHIVGEGQPISDVHLYRFPAGQVIDEQGHHRVVRPGLGVGFDVQGALNLGLIHLEVVIQDRPLIEAVVGELRAIRGPPHGRVLVQLFPVNPASGSEFGSGFQVPLGGDSDLSASIGSADKEVPILVESSKSAVWRHGRIVLAPSGRPIPPAEGSLLGRLEASQVHGFTRGDIVLLAAARPNVLERPPVFSPIHRKGSGYESIPDLRSHPLILIVAGHARKPVLPEE